MAKPRPADRLARLREKLAAAAPQCIASVIDALPVILMACPTSRSCGRCDAARRRQREYEAARPEAPVPRPMPTS